MQQSLQFNDGQPEENAAIREKVRLWAAFR
jgi:hypothetical protein